MASTVWARVILHFVQRASTSPPVFAVAMASPYSGPSTAEARSKRVQPSRGALHRTLARFGARAGRGPTLSYARHALHRLLTADHQAPASAGAVRGEHR